RANNTFVRSSNTLLITVSAAEVMITTTLIRTVTICAALQMRHTITTMIMRAVVALMITLMKRPCEVTCAMS
ncbi:MAG: hypothetical protein CMJ78_23940, partial [Planctomycetaceae bacterium]|nr:hypothetical protein [Planctomycetaceae bacterium]